MESQEGSDDAVDGAATEEELKTKVSSGKKSGLWKLYISRALTAWGDRLWSFGLGLFLLHVRTHLNIFLKCFRHQVVFLTIFRCDLKTY